MQPDPLQLPQARGYGNCRESGCMNTLCDSDEDDENYDADLASEDTV